MKRADITNLFPEATEEQVNALMNINGADINNAKKGIDDLQKALVETQGALEKAQQNSKAEELKEALDKVTSLQGELETMQAAEALRLIREKVSGETGVPAGLLTGDTEEACSDQAAAILKFAQPAGYPQLHDPGEVSVETKQTTREQFAEWFNNRA